MSPPVLVRHRDEAFAQLPETHAAAVRLGGRGFDRDAIAAALLLAPEALPQLLEVADGKLDPLLPRNAEKATCAE
jgi:hypothetical protein